MPECGPSAGQLRACPRERITLLSLTDEELRAKALDAARFPDADVSMPAVLLLMLLERQHTMRQRAVMAERARDMAHASMETMQRSTREMADKWEQQGTRYLCAIAAVHAADEVLHARIGKRLTKTDFARYRAELWLGEVPVERLEKATADGR
jgi:hypothetical protein